MFTAAQNRDLSLSPSAELLCGRGAPGARSGSKWRRKGSRIGPPDAEGFARFGKSVLRPYGVAIVLVLAAALSTLAIRGLFAYPFLFLFFAAVMASAWLGGTAAGLFAVLLSTVTVDYYFVAPFHSLVINATDSTYFVAFVACAIVASWVSSSKKKVQQELRDARDALEVRVAERTTELRMSNADLRHNIREREKTQQELMRTQAELAHLSRVLTMGELTSSIAHEINQPLTAVVTYGHACLEWLSARPPNLEEAREAAGRIISDGTRAGAILGRIRSLFKKAPAAKEWLDMNEVIRELTVFLRSEAVRQGVTVRTDLAADLPRVVGDRVRLQQVVLNLIMNGMEAVRRTESGVKEVVIRSGKDEGEGIRIVVEDSGVGLSAEIAEQIFQPFFTTKQQGIGMGLSISHSIVESHAGRLWGEPRASGGAVFQFTLPVGSQDGDR
jgi:C4-dicarboxylate-specific signal transduction histidine kinase